MKKTEVTIGVDTEFLNSLKKKLNKTNGDDVGDHHMNEINKMIEKWPEWKKTILK